MIAKDATKEPQGHYHSELQSQKKLILFGELSYSLVKNQRNNGLMIIFTFVVDAINFFVIVLIWLVQK